MTKRTQRLITGLLLVVATALVQRYSKKINNADNLIISKAPVINARNFASSTAAVVRVVDGDTIELDTGEKVRYIGVNAPESVDPRKPVECFGKEASEYNKSLVEGKAVGLVGDVGDKDKYGRLLRYVYLNDGTFVNLKLVQDGYASVMTVQPNVAYQKEFVAAQSKARENKVGLWNACK